MSATLSPPKSHRFNARIDAETEELLARAARTAGMKVGPFVIECARKEAQKILARADVTLIPAADFDALLESLNQPPTPPAELVDLFARPRVFTRA